MVIGKVKEALSKSGKPERKQQAAGWKVFKAAEPGPSGAVIYVFLIDPAAKGGTVTIDVVLDEALPRGARPDMSVDGTVELERLGNVLYVGRPAFGQVQAKASLFKLSADGASATLQPVEWGRSSASTIEIVRGLNAGDRVVLSDMSQWYPYGRIRLR